MKIDLRKLYSSKEVEINDQVIIPEEYYKNTDIIRIENLEVIGIVYTNIDDEFEIDAQVFGTFILPCSISLEEVKYDFNTEISEIIKQNEEKNQNSLELLDILWENIVSEVPIKVVKPELVTENIKGNGWELEIED